MRVLCLAVYIAVAVTSRLAVCQTLLGQPVHLLSGDMSLAESSRSRGGHLGASPRPEAAAQLDFPWEDSFIALNRLGNVWLPLCSDGDSMTDKFSAYAEQNDETICGTDGIRETWYISRDALTGTLPIYRLLSDPLSDHMDSLSQAEAPSLGYHYEYTQGYAWNSQLFGTLPLTRYFNGTIFDHRTWLNSQAPAQPGYGVYQSDSVWNTSNGVPRYGYERFANLLTDFAGSTVSKITFENSSYKVTLNRVQGNAAESIQYTNLPNFDHVELVRASLGDDVQAVVLNNNGNTVPSGCCTYNALQAGGTDGADYGQLQRWAGSPVLSSSLGGNPITQTSEIKPLNFVTNEWLRTDGYTPLLWRGVIKRTISLGYLIGSQIYGDVIHLGFQAKVDSATVTAYNPFNMNNTFWFDMTKFEQPVGNAASPTLELLNVASGQLVSLPLPMHPPQCPAAPCFDTTTTICPHVPGANDCTVIASPVGQALVISRPDRNLAVGIYSPSRDVARYQLLWWCDGGQLDQNYGCADPPGRPQGSSHALVVDTFNTSQNLSMDYGHNEDAFMVVGDRTTVLQRLQQIPGMSFYTLPPCRVLDTRNAGGPYGGPALVAGAAARIFTMTGQCGIPATARALSVNATITQPVQGGSIAVYPSDLAATPSTSTISYSAGQTRANNVIVALASDGDMAITVNQPTSGTTVQVIVDVNGYFQ